MILLYTFVGGLLGLVHWVVGRRVRSLERRYARTALEAEKLARDAQTRGGNGKTDAFANAKRLYHLGQVVEARDRLEKKYDRWQTWSDRLAQRRARLGRWRGKYVPYALGVADTLLIALTLQWAGLIDPINADALVEKVSAPFRS